MRAFLLRRVGSLSLAGLGVVSVLALGAVLAETSDSISVFENHVESSPYHSPMPELSMAVKGPGQEDASCADPLDYSEGARTGLWSVDLQDPVDWSAPGTQVLAGAPLCLRNTGAEPGTLTMRVAYLFDHEVGEACEPGERQAGDSTCGAFVDGGVGELSPFLRFRVTASASFAGESDSCTGDSGIRPLAFAEDEASQVLDVTLDPGESCAVSMTVLANGDADPPRGFPTLTENDKLLSQTDDVRFDTVFFIAP